MASTTSVMGTTACLRSGLSSSSPSTALSTEMAGVMSASQKKNAVPASASPTATFAQVLPGISRRCASANSARMPPSPSLSARMMTVTYLSVTEIVSAQKISDSTPRTAWVLKVPAAFTASCMVYSGLVPISPYTMPTVPTSEDRLQRRGCFMWPTSLSWPAFFSTAPRSPAAGRGAGRPQHAAAASGRTAAAGEDRIDVGRVVRLALNLVVVGELFARLDGTERVDEHPALFDDRLAVGRAGVVDEARLVTVDPRVDHRARIDDEQESVVVGGVLVLITPVRLGVRHALTQVLDDARALPDAARGEHPQPV